MAGGEGVKVGGGGPGRRTRDARDLLLESLHLLLELGEFLIHGDGWGGQLVGTMGVSLGNWDNS